ncbi:MAG: MFS transporter [Ancalomicrobiaceae bacterium]|nr:MFS transporter [Ancalomicrobiaceae bacterium]
MPSNIPPASERGSEPVLSAALTWLLASACGIVVANLYFAQPLAGPIGQSLGMSPHATGLIVTLTQLGFVSGLLFIVPLGDLIETRRLAVTLVGCVAVAALAAGLSSGPVVFLAASFAMGLSAVVAQVLVPYAAHLAPLERRGAAVGNVMGGLMVGIMMARPVASFIAGAGSWHWVFFLSVASLVILAIVLARLLPPRHPEARISYGALIGSMGRLALTNRVLQRRALYHAAMFGAFSLFWTVIPLRLAGPDFGLGQGGIGLFALAGVAGAIASPIAGRMADRGWTRPATAVSMLAVVVAFLISHVGVPGSTVSLGLNVFAAILLDFGVTTNLVLGQRAIFALGTAERSRINGLYIGIFFLGGAAGSAIGGWAFAEGGWLLASAIGAALPIAALLYFATERKPHGAAR